MQTKAIKRIQEYSKLLHGELFYFADSFGKDSCVVRDLLIRSNVPFETHHNITSCDPPELLRFGFKNHPEVIIHKPVKTMYQLIEKKGVPPTRMVAYCCDHLKERGGSGRFVVTGVRADESSKRATRQVAETCYRDPTKRYLNPIIDWTCGDVTGTPIGDVWEYIHAFNIPYCSLYDEGMTRIGCPLCPKASIKHRLYEIKRFPMKARGYLRCFRRALLIPHPTHKIQFQTEYDMLCWYIFGKKLCDVSNEKAEIIMAIGDL
jgi:phosphoadenosine phosphosulfate reductase